jgi:hypothetical protein
MKQLINFNGRMYNSVEEMPPDIRRAYEQVMGIFSDKDQNGVPDAFEGIASAGAEPIGLQSNNIFIYEGRRYQSVDELPLEARQKYEQALGRLDANRNGMPDFLEGIISVSPGAASNPDIADPTRPEPERPPAQSPSLVIEPEGVSPQWVVAAVVLIGLVCAGAAAVLLWMRQ